MDLQLVKKRLELTTSKHDTYLTEIIPDVVEFTKEYCNNKFLDVNGKEALPSGVRLFVPKACEYLLNKSGISQRTMGSVSYTYDLDFPPALLRLLRPYKKVRFR
jgi:hypothetical protein